MAGHITGGLASLTLRPNQLSPTSYSPIPLSVLPNQHKQKGDVLTDTLELKFGQGGYIKPSSLGDPWFPYV